MIEDEQREKDLLDTLEFLEKLPQEKLVESLLGGFKGWVQQYQEHLDSPISSNKRKQSSQLQEAFLGAWEIIITKVVSPENIEQVRNTLDDLMGDYDFLERKIRGRFGRNYGLGRLKRSQGRPRGASRPHTQFIDQKIDEGVTEFQQIWREFRRLDAQSEFQIDGESLVIDRKESEVVRYKLPSDTEYYPVHINTFRKACTRKLRKKLGH